ncbi:MAG: Haloalkane dehalogenase [uncultured Sphingomonadaceae bacterium]|uniref:Haloalkane dehalogenase n=1 Tax=uncultured Sphingomonadaceae bacterium TaxID=169976 RepID=A0A6J4RU27_9SPHN|nr:MAG: Haloalkane dehalogenase [uncultured Sphingomonadaceae bacterium]
MAALRTPDDRFRDLPGYPFAPRYAEDLPGYGGLRMHYLDEGEGEATFLCLHGQPTWSYLYRKMIPVFADAGRVITPDLFGFGRSDKPADDEAYSFDFHRGALLALVERLDLRDITLVCQDWGGLLGLTLPMDMPERFARLIVMNTGLNTGERPLGPGFEAWRAYNRAQPDLNVAALMKRGTPVLSDAEAAAYAAPFPDAAYKAGVRRFPELVNGTPNSPGAATSRRARDWWRDEWAGESFMAIGMQDPVITPNAMRALRENIRNCPEPMLVEEAGHFVQEWGEPVARTALAAFAK